MRALLKVALRSVKLNSRRMFLIGVAIFVSSFLLLFVCGAMNGAAVQTLKRYTSIQTGDVLVMWKNLYNTSNLNVERFIDVSDTMSFDPNNGSGNHQAVGRMNKFLSQNQDRIAATVPTIRRNAQIEEKKITDPAFIIYGIAPGSEKYLFQNGSLQLTSGAYLPRQKDTICISEEKARSDSIKLHDQIKVNLVTADGGTKTQEFTVTGLYEAGAFYDGFYGFIPYDQAEKLYNIDKSYADVYRIFLKNQNDSDRFATRLDSDLTKSGDLLRAQSYTEANLFFPNISSLVKLIFGTFILLLLLIVAVGLRSAVRMNIYERMKEFGTLRAIGFSRRQVFSLIFLEVFFLSAAFLIGAAAVSMILISILHFTGVYVGTTGASVFGGDRFYPFLQFSDILTVILIILLFSLVSVFGPGIHIVYQEITDILVNRQKHIHPLFKMVKGIFN